TLASCSATSSTPASLLLTSSRTSSPSTNSKIGYSRSTGQNFRNRTCCTYGVIAANLLWTDEPNERASLCTSRVPTRAEAPRHLTLDTAPYLLWSRNLQPKLKSITKVAIGERAEKPKTCNSIHTRRAGSVRDSHCPRSAYDGQCGNLHL